LYLFGMIRTHCNSYGLRVYEIWEACEACEACEAYGSETQEV
jgi:hypothetical protein